MHTLRTRLDSSIMKMTSKKGVKLIGVKVQGVKLIDQDFH